MSDCHNTSLTGDKGFGDILLQMKDLSESRAGRPGKAILLQETQTHGTCLLLSAATSCLAGRSSWGLRLVNFYPHSLVGTEDEGQLIKRYLILRKEKAAEVKRLLVQ